MTDRKNSVSRFRLWLRTFVKSGTTRFKDDQVHYIRPNLEALEERIVPAVMNPQPVDSFPSSAAPQLAAVLSFADSMMELRVQLFTAIEQNVIGAYQVLGQEIAQVMYSDQQEWDSFFGINPSSSDPSPSPAATQPSGGTLNGGGVSNPSANDATAPPVTTGHT